MERKVWRRPLTEVQKFEANEYVAACYHGVCNISGYVFNDTNGNGQYDPDVDRCDPSGDPAAALEGVSADSPQDKAQQDADDRHLQGDLQSPQHHGKNGG